MAREQAAEYGSSFAVSGGGVTSGRLETRSDGVAIVGEHGDYPRTRAGISCIHGGHFDQVTDVMKADGRVVPLLSDKYFAYECRTRSTCTIAFANAYSVYVRFDAAAHVA